MPTPLKESLVAEASDRRLDRCWLNKDIQVSDDFVEYDGSTSYARASD